MSDESVDIEQYIPSSRPDFSPGPDDVVDPGVGQKERTRIVTERMRRGAGVAKKKKPKDGGPSLLVVAAVVYLLAKAS